MVSCASIHKQGLLHHHNVEQLADVRYPGTVSAVQVNAPSQLSASSVSVHPANNENSIRIYSNIIPET